MGSSHGAAGSLSHCRENSFALGAGLTRGCRGWHGSPKGICSPCVTGEGSALAERQQLPAPLVASSPSPGWIPAGSSGTDPLSHPECKTWDGEGSHQRKLTHPVFSFHFWPDLGLSRLAGSRTSWAKLESWHGPGAPLALPAACPLAWVLGGSSSMGTGWLHRSHLSRDCSWGWWLRVSRELRAPRPIMWHGDRSLWAHHQPPRAP